MMTYFLTILVIAISLGLDAFSVSLAFGMCQKECSNQSKLRLSFSFGFFQFLMPIVGYWIGSTVASFVDKWDHWLVLTALVLIGCKMIWEGLEKEDQPKKFTDISRGVPLLIASVATSIDALAVGFSFAFLQFDLLTSSLIIGVVAFIMSYAGSHIGFKIGKRYFSKPEWIGGIALILLGIKFLLDGLNVF
ncbi:manganese efflux pump MntP family protein [bacterium]|nr:manganese efflux pump MntP family protein [bacterium]